MRDGMSFWSMAFSHQ
jgi:hypothetical protein